VTGTITVANPTPFTVEFEVDDTVNGTTAVVECPTYELGPGEDTTCTYEADLGDEDPGNGTNTAVITSLNEDVDGATAEDDYEFGDPTNIEGYETVNVSDTVQGDLGETSGDYIFEYSDDFECPTDTSLYVDGVYEFEVPNTATIDETGQSDDANVTVTCYAPVISKDATATYDRSWEWMIDKDGDQTDLTLAVGQVFTVNYTVVVTATPTDDDFEVKGTITVVKPEPG
jgi:large repetitive protein